MQEILIQLQDEMLEDSQCGWDNETIPIRLYYYPEMHKHKNALNMDDCLSHPYGSNSAIAYALTSSVRGST